jgi:SAM-dependent methyltransferase
VQEYDRADAAFYDYWARGLEGDAQFYVEEAQRAGSPALELGCGTGRILIPTAEAGVSIVGLDRAPSMLAIARRKLSQLDQKTRGRIELVEGDMRDFSLAQRFNLVMIPYRAFLHLHTSQDQRRALGCIREHLNDDGRLVLNIFDPRLDIIAAGRGWLGSALKKEQEFTNPETGRRVVIWTSTRYDLERQMLEEDRIFEEVDGEGRVVSKVYTPLVLRYVFRYEMEHLLELCGLKVEALYGDFNRGPFKHGGEQIWVARKG